MPNLRIHKTGYQDSTVNVVCGTNVEGCIGSEITNAAIVGLPSSACTASAITLSGTYTGGTQVVEDWSVSDSTIATISNGQITGLKYGTAVVTYKVYNSCSTATTTANITFYHTLTNVEVDVTSKTACSGTNFTITPTITPADAICGATTSWVSSQATDFSVANGVVTINNPGKTGTISYIVNPVCGNALTATTNVESYGLVSNAAIAGGGISIVTGNEITLTGSYSANGAKNPQVSWTTSNASNVAIVSSGNTSCVVRGGTVGTNATITYKVEDDCGGITTATTIITVSNCTPCESFTYTLDDYVCCGSTITGVLGGCGSLTNVSYSSSNNNVASVSSAGVVSGKTPGSAIITVSATDCAGNTLSPVSKTINVYRGVTGVTITSSSANMDTGTTRTITAVYDTTNVHNPSIRYESDNQSVISMSGNVATAVSPGTATITCYVNSDCNASEVSASQTITVNDACVPCESIIVYTDKQDLLIGETTQIQLQISSECTSPVTIDNYFSRQTNYATVDANGLVTAIAESYGTSTVNISVGAEFENCGRRQQDYTYVRVYSGPKNVAITGSSQSIKQLQSVSITGSCLSIYGQVLSIESLDTNIIELSNIQKTNTGITCTANARYTTGTTKVRFTVDFKGVIETRDWKITVNPMTPPTNAQITYYYTTCQGNTGNSISCDWTKGDTLGTDLVEWSSSDTSVLTVTPNSSITAKPNRALVAGISPGTAIITCRVYNAGGESIATREVTVPKNVTDSTFTDDTSHTIFTAYTNTQRGIIYNYSPSDATITSGQLPTITNNPGNCLTLTNLENGTGILNIGYVSGGSSSGVTGTLAYRPSGPCSGQNKTMSVTILRPLTGVTTSSEYYCNPGETQWVYADLQPYFGHYDSISWSVADETIAAITESEGNHMVIEGVGLGQTTFTVTATDNGNTFTASGTIYVQYGNLECLSYAKTTSPEPGPEPNATDPTYCGFAVAKGQSDSFYVEAQGWNMKLTEWDFVPNAIDINEQGAISYSYEEYIPDNPGGGDLPLGATRGEDIPPYIKVTVEGITPGKIMFEVSATDTNDNIRTLYVPIYVYGTDTEDNYKIANQSWTNLERYPLFSNEGDVKKCPTSSELKALLPPLSIPGDENTMPSPDSFDLSDVYEGSYYGLALEKETIRYAETSTVSVPSGSSLNLVFSDNTIKLPEIKGLTQEECETLTEEIRDEGQFDENESIISARLYSNGDDPIDLYVGIVYNVFSAAKVTMIIIPDLDTFYEFMDEQEGQYEDCYLAIERFADYDDNQTVKQVDIDVSYIASTAITEEVSGDICYQPQPGNEH